MKFTINHAIKLAGSSYEFPGVFRTAKAVAEDLENNHLLSFEDIKNKRRLFWILTIFFPRNHP